MTGLSSHEFKQSMKTRQGQNFKHSRHHYWNRVWSMKYEENKHKNECNRWSKVYKGGKYMNQLNEGPYNFDIQWSKSSPLNRFWQIHDSNKVFVLHRTCGAIKPVFFHILPSHFLYQYPLFTLPCTGLSFLMIWWGLG